jgi:hypothetical protein
MASTPLTKIEIEELRRLIKLLDKEVSDVEFNNLIASGPAAKKLLDNLRGEAHAFTSDISDTALSFKRVLNEIKNTQSGVNDAARAYTGILSIAEELQSHQKDIANINEKDLSKLQQKLNLNLQSLKNTSELLKLEEQDLKHQEKSKNNEQDRIRFQVDLLEAAEKALKGQLNADGTKKKLSKEDQERLEKLKNTYSSIDKELDRINGKLEKNKDTQIEISGVIDGEDAHYKTLTSTIDTINRQLKDQKELLGLGGVAVEGIGKALDKLGFGGLASRLGIDEAQQKMKDFSADIIKNREKELALQHQVRQNEEEIAKTLVNEKALEDEIATTRGLLSDKQLRSGFGGKELKLKQLELDAIRDGRGEQEKVLSQNQANLNVISASNKQYAGMNGTTAVLQQGVKALGANFQKALGPVGLILMAITEVIEAAKVVDKEAGDMAKGMNITYGEALNLREELGTVADLSMDSAVQTKGLQESLMAVNKTLGSRAMLNQEDLVTMTKLTKQAGYTHDELMEIEKISLINGKTLEDNTKEILGSAAAYAAQNKLVVNEKEILREVNKASSSLKLSLGGSTAALAEAVVKTKQFGLNLEQAEKISQGLLSFESSINAELEAEMLTGKALNLEKARYLALTGDAAGAAAEIAKQVGSAAEFGKMNVIQQEAIAKAAGLSRDELAKSLIDKEALAKLSEVEGKDAQEKFNNLVKQVGMEEAKKRLGNDQLANQFQQQSVQERFNQSVEKLKELFTRVAEPLLQILEPLVEIADVILPAINVLLFPIMNGLKAIGKYIVTFLQEPMKAFKDIFGGVMDLFKGDFESGLKKIGTGLIRVVLIPFQAILNGVMSSVNGTVDLINKIPGVNIDKFKEMDLTSLITGDDVVSKDGYGKRTLLGPEGAIQLNDKDTVIAGTNLFPETNLNTNNTNTQSVTNNSVTSNATNRTTTLSDSQVLGTLQAIEGVLKNIYAKEAITEIKMDSEIVGRSVTPAVNMTTNKTYTSI